MGAFRDLSGVRYGRLVVLKHLPDRTTDGKILWQCLCDCGTIKNVRGSSLKRGDTKSCGCLQRENAIKQTSKLSKKTHGRSSSVAYDKAAKEYFGENATTNESLGLY